MKWLWSMKGRNINSRTVSYTHLDVYKRQLETIVTDYVSIGDYVLTGGELPSMVMIDAVSRLVPGVLKNEESAEFESFHNNLLEYPQYTRPEVWQGKTVPDILLSGDHAKVDKWRLLQSEERTRERRPDLYEAYAREGKALSWLLKKKIAHMDMIEVIRRGQAELLCGEEEGVLLRDVPSGAYMMSAADEDMGERLLSLIPRGLKDGLYVAPQEFLKESICRRFKGSVINTCVQAVYTRKTPLEEDSRFCIKTLDTSYLGEVYFHYHAVHDLSLIHILNYRIILPDNYKLVDRIGPFLGGRFLEVYRKENQVTK